MLLTDPEVESSLLISSDEGATYQKYRLNFYIHSLLFHPKQEDWILAYSQDQKVRVVALFAQGEPRASISLCNCCRAFRTVFGVTPGQSMEIPVKISKWASAVFLGRSPLLLTWQSVFIHPSFWQYCVTGNGQRRQLGSFTNL